MNKARDKAVLDAAIKHIVGMEERGDLESRHNDHDDFLDIAVWCLQAALEAAYDEGYRQGFSNAKKMS